MKAKLAVFAEDLAHLSETEIREACRLYRIDGGNSFMATSGHLLDLAAQARRKAAFIDASIHDWVVRLGTFHGLVEGYRTNYWDGQWGPRPGTPGCRVPPEAQAMFEGLAVRK